MSRETEPPVQISLFEIFVLVLMSGLAAFLIQVFGRIALPYVIGVGGAAVGRLFFWARKAGKIRSFFSFHGYMLPFHGYFWVVSSPPTSSIGRQRLLKLPKSGSF